MNPSAARLGPAPYEVPGVAALTLVGRASIDGTVISREAERMDPLDVVALAPRPDLVVTTTAERVELAAGGEVTLTVKVERHNGFTGRVPISVMNLTHGYSNPGPSPRTARRIASELAELVDRSGIAGPVVLVAASSGGFDVRVFASDRPDRVAGLVLVDASHERPAHEIPRLARFVPLLSSVGTSDCSAFRSA